MREKRNRLTDSLLIKTILDNSEDMLYFKDDKSCFLRNSRSHLAILGFTDPELLLGKSDFDVSPSSFAEASRRDELEIMQTGTPRIGLVEHMVDPDGTEHWYSASKYPLRDASGDVIGTWGISRDVTEITRAQQEMARLNAELEEANAMLQQLSIRDELSGLFNHRFFYETLQHQADLAIRRRRSGFDASLSLVLLDIDGFKSINDQFGHLTGDLAIHHVASLLSAHARASDTCCRHGGDEFALILPDTSLREGLELAERLRSVVAASPLVLASGPLQLNISMGVAEHVGSQNAQALFHTADQRLYQSKSKGKNRVS